MTHRYPYGAKWRDVMLALMAGFLVALILAGWLSLRSPGGHAHLTITVLLAAALVFLVPRIVLKWRSLLRVDGEGVGFYRSARSPRVVIPWNEVRELRHVGAAEVVVVGEGGRIRISGPYDDTGDAVRRVTELAEPVIRERLEREERERGIVVFRTPGSAAVGHILYFLIVLALAVATTVGVTSAIQSSEGLRAGALVVIGIVVAVLLAVAARLKRQAGWYHAWVALGPGGVLIHRLDGEKWLPWSHVRGASWNDRGNLDVVLRWGAAVEVPRTLGNVSLLQDFIGEAAERHGVEVEEE